MKGTLPLLVPEPYKASYLQKFKGLNRKSLHLELRAQLPVSLFRRVFAPSDPPKHIKQHKIKVSKLAAFRKGFKSSDELNIFIEAPKGKLIIPAKDISRIYLTYDNNAKPASGVIRQDNDLQVQRMMRAIDARIVASQNPTPVRSRCRNTSLPKLPNSISGILRSPDSSLRQPSPQLG